MSRFVLATANPDKAAQMRSILEPLGLTVEERPANIPDVDETEDTLEGNSHLKAAAIARATGRAAIADDTGLFVDALGGRPGVYSARYAGERATYRQNVEKLLDELRFVAEPRLAQFRSVIVVAYPDGDWFGVEGVLEGAISRHARGEGGFGYDPVFELLGNDRRTLAELSADEKNAVSHRGLALRALVQELGAR
ncbi:MAG: RdgB/HAM1 family non-canonical purine NTP pyrophosphatase [Acidimicrobiales bacterium]